jgi:phosphoribosylaminoimidazole-succinocarboxamide synthase
MEFRDSATAGNGAKKAELDGKGALNAEISYILYQYLEKNGIETHLIKRLDETRMLVKNVDIIKVEVIVRNIAAGGFSKKYGVPEGTPLKNTVIEFCLKSDEYGDPMMNESQITALGIASQEDLETLKTMALRINTLLSSLFDKCDIILVDFKLEFGLYDGRIILSDEISPDSCRLWDKATGKKLDKDRFRRDLGDVLGAYREVLRRLKNAQQV